MLHKKIGKVALASLLGTSILLGTGTHAATATEETPPLIEDTNDVLSNENTILSVEDTFEYKDYSTKTYLKNSKNYIHKYKKEEKRIGSLKTHLKTYTDILDTLEHLEKEKRAKVAYLDNLELDSDEKSEKMQEVKNKINLLIERINKKELEKTETESSISLTKKKIKKLEMKLAAREDVFRERIKESRDTNPFATYLSIVFSGSNLSDILMKYQMMKTISAEDNRIIEEYLATEKELTKEKTLLNKTKNHLEIIILELHKLKKESEKEFGKLSDEYGNLLTSVENANKKLSKLNKQIVSQQELQLEIEQLLQREWHKVENYKIYTSKKIEELDETVAGLATELLRIAEENEIQIKVTEGFRSFEYQNNLYAQGRSSGGAVVTNARGGESYHNYGIAFDVAFVDKNGKITWDNLDQNNNGKDDWTEIGLLGESIGLEWGGRWTSFVDRPHFQLTGGKSIADLYEDYVGEQYIGNKKDDGTKDVITVEEPTEADTKENKKDDAETSAQERNDTNATDQDTED